MVYKKKPKNFDPIFVVATCIFIHGGETLLLLRSPGKSEGGKWGMPGGKVNMKEGLHEAVIREVFEETKVVLDKNDITYFRKFWVDTRGKQFEYHLFYAVFDERPEIETDTGQHTESKWVQLAACLNENLVSDHPACMRVFLRETDI